MESQLTTESLGAGVLLTYPYPTSKVTVPMAVQPRDRTGYLFDLLRFPNPGTSDAEIARMVKQNRWLYDRAVELGAKRYLVGGGAGPDHRGLAAPLRPELRDAVRREAPLRPRQRPHPRPGLLRLTEHGPGPLLRERPFPFIPLEE